MLEWRVVRHEPGKVIRLVRVGDQIVEFLFRITITNIDITFSNNRFHGAVQVRGQGLNRWSIDSGLDFSDQRVITEKFLVD